MDVVRDLEFLSKDVENQEIIASCKENLQKFIAGNESSTEFFSKFVKDAYLVLIDTAMSFFELEKFDLELKMKILHFLRLLSRDKQLVLSMKDLNRCIVCFARCIDRAYLSDPDKSCAIEALKCLLNWTYHSKPVRDCLLNYNTTQSFVKFLSKSKDNLDDFLHFQLRMIFLMSAHENEFRVSMVKLEVLQTLDSILKLVLPSLENENK